MSDVNTRLGGPSCEIHDIISGAACDVVLSALVECEVCAIINRQHTHSSSEQLFVIS